MPELPEVELARETLLETSLAREIERVDVFDDRILAGTTRRALRRALVGHAITRVDRHGKQLLATLDDGSLCFLHLGMTGKLVFRRAGDAPPPFARLALSFGDAGTLFFRDPRLFGRVVAGDPARVRALARTDALGPDALAIGASGARLRAALGRGKLPIKTALMDQARLAGLGNIQATEALFRAKVHPELPLDQLDARTAARLARGIAATLAHTLDTGRRDAARDGELAYVSEGGDNPFSVYGREGEPCPRCKTPIARRKSGGRSTYFCPECQEKPVP